MWNASDVQKHPVKLNRKMKIIYIYGTMVATSCDLNAPRCTTTVPQVRLHRSRGVSSLITDPRDPGDPLQLIINRNFTSIQMLYTHTHSLTHTLPPSLTHPLTHLLTHSPLTPRAMETLWVPCGNSTGTLRGLSGNCQGTLYRSLTGALRELYGNFTKILRGRCVKQGILRELYRTLQEQNRKPYGQAVRETL